MTSQMLLMLVMVLLFAPFSLQPSASAAHGVQHDHEPLPMATHRMLSEEEPSAVNATAGHSPNATLDAMIANHSQAIKACSASTSAYRTFNATSIAALGAAPTKTQWPELACQPAEVATAVIKQERPDLTVIAIASDAATILNYDESRVFLLVDEQGLVDPQFTPTVG